MIDFYTADTPNGYRVEFMLEELGLACTRHQLSLSMGETHTAEFLRINPSGRIPAIVDHDGLEGKVIKLSQSAAILLYLAEKTGKFLPRDISTRAKALEWLIFDASDVATSRFDAFYLSRRNQTEAYEFLKERVMEYYTIYNQRLASRLFLAGNEFSIADIAAYPWAKAMEHHGMRKLHNLQRWMNEIGKRNSVRKLAKKSEKEEI